MWFYHWNQLHQQAKKGVLGSSKIDNVTSWIDIMYLTRNNETNALCNLFYEYY